MAISRPFGHRLRERRLALGLKQAEVARAAGLSPSFLNLIEHDRRRVRAEVLARLADVLQTAPEALLGAGEGEMRLRLRQIAQRAAPEESARLGPEIDDFLARFPAWAEVLLAGEARAGRVEAALAALSERLTQDPFLSEGLHDLLSALSAVRATAGILAESEAMPAAQRARFHQNLHMEAERLARGGAALVAYLEGAGGAAAGAEGGPERGPAGQSPQEEGEAWLAAQGWDLAALGRQGEAAPGGLSAAAAAWLRPWAGLAAAESAQGPSPGAWAEALARFGPDPWALAQALSRSVPEVMRRLALAPGALGLVIADGAGALLLRKPLPGFALPRFGPACTRWPLFAALAQPLWPQRAEVQIIGPGAEAAEGRRFRLWAYAAPLGPAERQAWGLTGSAEESPLYRAQMLILPPGPESAPAPLQIGTHCRLCPHPACPARREASLV
jgi:transcriptional regulator with XRE-family HTH domain